jgi:hypothetical protein
MTEQKISRMCVKMAEFTLAKWLCSSKIADDLSKWLWTVKKHTCKMVEFTLAKWLSSSKIADALSKWLREPRKMTESREVVVVWGPSARSRTCWLDQDAAWTCGAGSTRASQLWPARVRAGIGRAGCDWSGEPLARSVTDWLVWVMDQWVYHPRWCITSVYIYIYMCVDIYIHIYM